MRASRGQQRNSPLPSPPQDAAPRPGGLLQLALAGLDDSAPCLPISPMSVVSSASACSPLTRPRTTHPTPHSPRTREPRRSDAIHDGLDAT